MKKKIFNCKQCDREYKHSSNLKAHIESIHENRRHLCKICGKNFNRRNNLSRHIRFVHRGNGVTNYSVLINKGEVSKSLDWSFQCQKCDSSFDNYDGFRLHICDVHKKRRFNFRERKMYKEDAPTYTPLVTTERDQQSPATPTVLSRPNISLRTKSLRKAKKESSTNPLSNQTFTTSFNCKDCDRFYSSASNLYRHMRNFHKNQAQTNFSQISRRNFKNHDEHIERKYSGKKLTNQSGTNNEKVEVKQKPILIQSTPLNQPDHNNKTIITPFKCEICNRFFHNKFNVNRHISTVHKNQAQTNFCKISQRNFKNDGVLHQHIDLKIKGKKLTNQSGVNNENVQVKQEPILIHATPLNQTEQLDEQEDDISELKEIYNRLPDYIKYEKSLAKFEEKFQNFLLQIKNEIIH